MPVIPAFNSAFTTRERDITHKPTTIESLIGEGKGVGRIFNYFGRDLFYPGDYCRLVSLWNFVRVLAEFFLTLLVKVNRNSTNDDDGG